MDRVSSDGSVPADQLWRRLQALHQALLASHSATEALELWCGGGAGLIRLQVEKRAAPRRPLPEVLRAALAIESDQPLEYRSVALIHAGETLSEAENWYLPARLQASMQHALLHSDRPFGAIVKELGFARTTLQVDWLWQPGESPVSPEPALPWSLLRHHAVLHRADGAPFSAVIETYTRAVLQFGPGDASPV